MDKEYTDAELTAFAIKVLGWTTYEQYNQELDESTNSNVEYETVYLLQSTSEYVMHKKDFSPATKIEQALMVAGVLRSTKDYFTSITPLGIDKFTLAIWDRPVEGGEELYGGTLQRSDCARKIMETLKEVENGN